MGIFRRIDIQKQAVLAVGIGLPFPELVIVKRLLGHLCLVVEGPGLIAAVAKGRGIVDAVPSGDLNRVLPAPGCGIANALVGGDAGNASGAALNRSTGCLNQIIHMVSSLLFLLFYTDAALFSIRIFPILLQILQEEIAFSSLVCYSMARYEKKDVDQ